MLDFLYVRWTKTVKFGGTIYDGDSHLEFSNLHFKVFRLHAILHDALGVMQAHSGKGAGYCYMIWRGPNSCLLGYLTKLILCLFVKFCLTSLFVSVVFWFSMSCIVLDFELAGNDVNKELEVFLLGKFLVVGVPTSSSKKVQTQKTSFFLY